jgi:lipopolysaccharide/colanic/teichoic acid biosynthesis glycosyltransferase
MFHRLKQIILLIGDGIILLAALFAMLEVYKLRGPVSNFIIEQHLIGFLPIFPLWIIMFYIEGLYSFRSIERSNVAISCIRGSLFATILTSIYFYLSPFTNINPKTNLIIFFLFSVIAIYLFRAIFFKIFSTSGLNLKVKIMGEGQYIDELKNVVNEKPFLGFQIVDSKEDIIAVERKLFSDEKLMRELLNKLDQNKTIVEISKFTELVTGKVHPDSIDASWFIENINPRNERFYRFQKAVLDRSISILLMLIVIPVYIVLFPILLLVSGRPLFYSQIRTGQNNRPFRIYKLRTMSNDAEKEGAKWATPGDSRVTPIGKFLRKTRLDELPQLWNIINGDMSIVGPRPERPEIIESQLEPKIPYYRLRHLVKPGVTGWAQINYRYGYSENDSLIKLTYDLYYVKNKSIWLDIKIILRTVKTVVTGAGQ